MLYLLSILMSVILGPCFGLSLSFADEQASTSEARAIEQAKFATVGILQSDVMPTDGPAYGAPVTIRGSGIHLGDGVILTARHAVERSACR
jgi:hypothetical protein